MRAGRLVLATGLAMMLGCDGDRPAAGPPLEDRIVEYFRRTVSAPGVAFSVVRLEPATIPGWRRGDLEVRLGPRSRHEVFHVSDDGRWLFRGEAADLASDPRADVVRRIALDGRPVRGPADAPVTLVMFGDFQCPYTGHAWMVVRDVALAGRPEQVRLVFKHLPDASTHPWAEDASLAAECAAQQSADGFWTIHDALFEQQARLSRETLAGAVAAMARAGGLDADRLAACVRDRGASVVLDADRAEAAALGVADTPTLFVNGMRLTGAPTDESLAHAIDDALASRRDVPLRSAR